MQHDQTTTPNLTNTTDVGEYAEFFGFVQLVLFCVGCSILILLTVINNTLVLLSYWRDPLLKDVRNLYLMHLAFCDLMTGAVTMPLYMYFTISKFSWGLGRVVCKLYLAMDHVFTNMTSLLVVLVAWDQLDRLKLQSSYQLIETKRDAYKRLLLWWGFTIVLNLPAILFWDVMAGVTRIAPDECDVEYRDSWEFMFATEVITVIIPVACLSDIYGVLVFAIKHRLFEHHYTRNFMGSQSDVSLSESDAIVPVSEPRTSTAEAPSDNVRLVSFVRKLMKEADDQKLAQQKKEMKTVRPKLVTRGEWVETTLVYLVGAFFICWMPYSLAVIIKAVCGSCLNPYVFEFFRVLQWSKACFNPFVYAYSDPLYSANFYHIGKRVMQRRCIELMCSPEPDESWDEGDSAGGEVNWRRRKSTQEPQVPQKNDPFAESVKMSMLPKALLQADWDYVQSSSLVASPLLSPLSFSMTDDSNTQETLTPDRTVTTSVFEQSEQKMLQDLHRETEV